MLAVPGLGALAWFGAMENVGDLHVLVMNAMMILILVHAAAGLLHHYVFKDGLLARMVPGMKA
jgi:cytochrome b561